MSGRSRVVLGCATLVAFAAASGCAPRGGSPGHGSPAATAAASTPADLGGTSWQLVNFQGGDGTT